MTDEAKIGAPMSDETALKGVLAMLGRMDSRLTSMEGRLPSDEQRAFEQQVFQTAQNIERIYDWTCVVVSFGRKVGLWLTGIAAGYIAAKHFIMTEWDFISQLWRKP